MNRTRILISADWTVNDVVASYPSVLPVLGRYGIDSCCGEFKTLAEVATSHHLSLPRLLADLKESSGTRSGRTAKRTRPVGRTSPTDERPAQTLTGPHLVFDLRAELAQLRDEEAWRREGHNAKTLVKEADLRLVLVTLQSTIWLPSHRAPNRTAIQVIEGRVRVHTADHAVDLSVEMMLSLAGGIPHAVEAVEESAFLLTMPWSDRKL